MRQHAELGPAIFYFAGSRRRSGNDGEQGVVTDSR